MTLCYRSLSREECDRLREIDASQYIGRAWRMVNGQRALVTIDYLDPDYPEGYANHLARARATVEGGGVVVGALSERRLVGFAAVNRDVFGVLQRYALLDQLFVTRQLRGKGIGRALLKHAAEQASRWGAEKLYICAGSAEETIAFYRAMGCRDAAEVDAAIADDDPRDLQLELDVT